MKQVGSRKKRVLRRFGTVLILSGTAGLVLTAYQGIHQWQTLRWFEAQAKIVNVNYREYASRRADRGAAELRLSYEYKVDGRTYHSEDITRGNMIYKRDTQSVSLLAKQFRAGDTAVVYYNPRHPDEAVIIRGVNWMTLIGSASISGVALFVGYGLGRYDQFLKVRKTG